MTINRPITFVYSCWQRTVRHYRCITRTALSVNNSRFWPAAARTDIPWVFVSCDLELGGVPAVRPSSKKFFRFEWNLVCAYRSMSDARRYAVWPDSRSRSWRLWSFENCTFPTLSPPPFTMAAGKWPLILKLQHNIEIWSDRIFHICRSFCVTHVTLNLVSASTKKSFSNFNEIWYVGRGWWVMHDHMPYDLIQGQGQGHK